MTFRDPVLWATAGLGVWLPAHVILGADPERMASLTLVSQCLVLAFSLAVVLVLLRRSPVALWYPVTWFYLTSAAYYGLGPMLYSFASRATVEYAEIFWYVGDRDLHATTTLDLAGIVLVGIAYLLLRELWSSKAPEDEPVAEQSDVPELRWIALVFVVVGGPLNYFYVLPWALGLVDFVMPGALVQFATLSTLSLVPLYLLYRVGGRKYLLPLLLVLGVEAVASFAMLSKLAMLRVGIALTLAVALWRLNLRKLVVLGAVAALLYVFILSPFVSFARVAFSVTGLTSTTEVREAAGMLTSEGVQPLDLQDASPSWWWNRLNYAPPQAFVMQQYDAGTPGATFDLIPYVLLPRMLFPEKPIMTTGVDFNYLVTGNPNSQSGPGMFGEGYWNGGWGGVCFVGLMMGAVYWGWERYARKHLRGSGLMYIPLMWIGIMSAIQQDGWFVPAIIGALPLAVAMHLILWGANRVAGLRRPPADTAGSAE